VAALRGLVEEKFRGLAIDSAEFGEQMRSVAPEVYVYAVRLLDGGHLLPRARVVLSLTGVVADSAASAGFEGLLTSVLTLDLFEPPQRERIRLEAVKLVADGMTQREAAGELEVTQPAVTAALKLDRLMRERGLTSPYELLEEPPSDYPKQRRHLNPKYRFETLEGYQRPPL
jgi:site-specific DNA recombinase